MNTSESTPALLDESNQAIRKTLGQQLRDGFKIVFALDFRSLALLRVGLGLIILIDLWFRSATLTELYTDEGFFTRQLVYEYYQTNWGDGWNTVYWSFHFLTGSPNAVASLFCLAGFFAVLLVLGKWTRFAAFASFLMLVSLHTRNPVVISSADFFLKLMLFWSIFLPLGQVWSLDSRYRTTLPSGTKPDRVSIANVATAGFVIQIFILYFFTGLAKWNEGWWSGEAMYHALGLDIYVKPFGQNLLAYPLLLKLLSIGTVAAEVFLIWTLFFAVKNAVYRWINLAVFWSFHIGIALCMSIGLFSWICMLGWFALLPTSFWEWISTRLRAASLEHESRTVDKGTLLYQAQQVFCALMILFALGWNIGNIESQSITKIRSVFLTKIGYAFGLNQHFQMFGQPPQTNPWFVYEATLNDGSTIDLLSGKPVNRDGAIGMRLRLQNFHWRKLHRNLVEPSQAVLRVPLADYQAEKWNRENSENEIQRLRFIYYRKETSRQGIESRNQYSQVWATINNESEGAGSLFDRLKETDPDQGLELGF